MAKPQLRWSSGRERSEHPGRDHCTRWVISTSSISGAGLDQRVGSISGRGPVSVLGLDRRVG
ncbi:hypothetical protein A5788_08690 [Gordonia sp. 852002-50816_SCH5313054-c]|nr:hypothetical protein A5785_13575 [Gordonia sp. 852002-50395_SCH5434458]OBC16775.1 hypothetical protein A5786_02165 [Gordonia sp. 852002-50816_SCH5313054-a]OBC19656.1 hypothetical protein A5788_08690 [Gordonia sp. 852002-50816_SCH5313054-c]